MADTLSASLTAFRQEIDRYLERIVPQSPTTLYDPVRHILGAGGKRVRPMLTALAARLGDSSNAWIPAGAAVELLHTFTLVHDDIMDSAPTRRGKPTTHVQFGTSAAILAGDALIALATEALSEIPSVENTMLSEFAKGFRLVCEGQALDKEYETRDDISVEEYLHMIDLKTSKVIELAGVLGASLAGTKFVEPIRRFAHHAGLAFQINDDLLDLTAKEAEFGKTIGGDILEGKRTYLFVSAMPLLNDLSPDERSLLARIRDRKALAEDISPARSLFDRLGILRRAAEAAQEQTALANQALAELPNSPAKQDLLKFGAMLLGRVS